MKFLKKPVVTQFEALRLADRLEKYLEIETNDQAAVELRRLHEENERLRQALAQQDSTCNGMPAYEGSLSKSQALAQPEQEPVAWMQPTTSGTYLSDTKDEWHTIPIYTVPPKREWVGLTDEERVEANDECDGWLHMALIIEAKLKEKNCV